MTTEAKTNKPSKNRIALLSRSIKSAVWAGATDRKLLLCSLLFTFVLGFAAHGYGFTNLFLTHDSLALFLYGYQGKFQLGRFMNGIIHLLLGETVIMPLFSGVIGLTAIALAVYITVKAFRLSSLWQVFVVSGIYSLNISVTCCIATFLFDFTSNTAALLFACSAMYCWTLYREGKKNQNCLPLIAGILLVVCAMGCYQAYLSVIMVLMMLWCIMRLLNGEKPKDIIVHGLKGIAMVVIGGVFYLLLAKVACALIGVELASNENYNSVTKLWDVSGLSAGEILLRYAERFVDSYRKTADHFVGRSFLSMRMIALNAVLILLFVLAYGKRLFTLHPASAALCVVLTVFLPPVMMLTYIMSGISHDLTIIAIWLLYLLAMLIFQGCRCQPLRRIAKGVFLLILVCLIGTANRAYVQKEIVCESTKTLMSNVINRMERMEDYEVGKTPVTFIGSPEKCLSVFQKTEVNITCCDQSFAITYEGTDSAYTNLVLQYPINWNYEKKDELAQSDEVKALPAYPDTGCVAMIDGVMVVKFPE